MNNFSLVRRETMQLLSNRLRLRIDLQFVLDQLSRDSQHIRRLPCEYVSVILQKLDERAFLFIVQAGADDGSLALISESRLILLVSSVVRIEVAA